MVAPAALRPWAWLQPAVVPALGGGRNAPLPEANGNWWAYDGVPTGIVFLDRSAGHTLPRIWLLAFPA